MSNSKDDLNDLLKPRGFSNALPDELIANPFSDASYNNPLTNTQSTESMQEGNFTNAPLQQKEILQQENLDQDRSESFSSVKALHSQPTTTSTPNIQRQANDDFQVSVSDPHKVGDSLNAYTVYKVMTQTKDPQFKSPHNVVQRRFREFLWLYNQLVQSNPGVIVPPPPEKHALGRFEEDFVENRRVLLERTLKRIVQHPILAKDANLRVFLEVDDLTPYMQEKKKESTGKMGLFSKLGDAMSSGISFSGKIHDPDEWFDQKKNFADQLEQQLKSVAKAVDGMIKHREDLAASTMEFSDNLYALASAEINKNLERQLDAFGEAQKKVSQLHLQQSKQDLFHLANMLDEYIRMIQSIKNTFSTRLKMYQLNQHAHQNLSKLRIQLEKTKMTTKTKPEKVSALESEILEAEHKIVETKNEFEEISKIIKDEMEVFEKTKIMDIQEAIQGFLLALTQHQESIIGVWSGFLQQNS